VPFFVRWPGKVNPGDCDHICAFWDFLPTAAELAGAEPPQTIDGISLVPVLTGRPQRQQQHKYLYWENMHVQAARKGRYRAHRAHPSQPTEIYDLVADEGSTNDLAQKRPDLVEQFEQIFRDARFDSPWYVNPGETKQQINAKRKLAADRGEMIELVPPNDRSLRKEP
jgi:arylsulfatase A-like enzyme